VLYLEVASDNPSHYRIFSDIVDEDQNSFSFVMPMWTFPELTSMQPTSLTFTETEAKFLFDMFGGIARYFHPIAQNIVLETAQHDVVSSCADWFFPLNIKLQYPNTWNRALCAVQSRIFKKMENFGNKYDIAYSSGLIWNKRESEFTSPFMKFLTGCLNNGKEANLWNEIEGLFGGAGRGIAFESLGHKALIANNHEYTAKNLKTQVANNFKQINKSFFNLTRYLIRTVEDIEHLPDNMYGLPVTPNFKLVDAVIQPNILLQFTVSETHGNDTDDYTEIRSKLRSTDPSTHALIFVVPTKVTARTFKPVGIPVNLNCYLMHYDMAAPSVLGKRRK
jgi:hypothetical protein